MKTLLKYLAIGLSILIMISMGVLLLLTQSQAARSWVESEIKSQLLERYDIRLAYADSRFSYENGLWQLGLRELRVERQSHRPVQINTLRATFTSLAFWDEANFRSEIAIEGVRADLSIQSDALAIPSLGLSVSPSEVQELLGEPSDPKQEERRISSLRWKDIEVEVAYGDVAREKFRVQSSGAWSRASGLTSLSLASTRIDLDRLLDAAAGFAIQVPQLSQAGAVLALSDALEAGGLDAIRLDCGDGKSCQGGFRIEGLALKGEGWIPGLRGISGAIHLDEDRIVISLPPSLWELDYPYVSAEVLPLTLGESKIDIQLTTDVIKIRWPEWDLAFDGIQSHSRLALDIPRESPSRSKLDLEIKGRGKKLRTVFERLPKELIGEEVKKWLLGNFDQGQVGDFSVGVVGTLPATPLIRVDARFRDVGLRYHDEWPRLSSCQGKFQMRALDMDVIIDRCLSEKVVAESGRVEIRGIEAGRAEIGIHAEVRSGIKEAFAFLSQSSLKSLGQAFLDLPLLAGAQNTSFDLNIPLGESSKKPLTIAGTSRLTNLRFAVQNGIFSGESPLVQLEFDQKGLKSLRGPVRSERDHSELSLTRDDRGDYLSGTIRAIEAGEFPLSGSFKIMPSSSPDLVTAMISGYKPATGGGSLDFKTFRWQLGPRASLGATGSARVSDLGKLAGLFGLKDKFRKGEGNINFDLYLADFSSKLGAPSIEGSLDFAMQKGDILNLPRTAVTLLDFANLSALGLRSEAMAYYSMNGQLSFQEGRVAIDRSRFDLGIVEARMTGDVDYRGDRLNLTLDIIPNLGSPAAAVLIGLWNPLVGLGLFGLSQVQEKSSDSFLNRVLSQTYKLDGAIGDTKVHLIRPLNIKAAFGE